MVAPWVAFWPTTSCARPRAAASQAEEALELAYGEDVAGALREHAPSLVYEPGERELPVDWRRCRQASCANAPDDPALDAHLGGGRHVRATAFTHVIRRGGRLYLQYWLYYPDSNTAVAGSDRLWERSWILPRAPGACVRHARTTPAFTATTGRASSSASIRTGAPGSGRARTATTRAASGGNAETSGSARPAGSASRGAATPGTCRSARPRRDRRNAPEIPRFITPPQPPSPRRPRVPLVPGRNLDERSTSGEGLRLIPLETLDRGLLPPARRRGEAALEEAGLLGSGDGRVLAHSGVSRVYPGDVKGSRCP